MTMRGLIRKEMEGKGKDTNGRRTGEGHRGNAWEDRHEGAHTRGRKR